MCWNKSVTADDRHLLLHAGAGPWLSFLRWSLPLLIVLATFASPIAWSWKLSIWVCAVVFFVLASRLPPLRQKISSVRLYPNGALTLFLADETEQLASVSRSFWVTRLVTVLPVSGKHGGLLVCASRNRREDYRRLMVWARLQPWAVNGKTNSIDR
jgi:hypothetical protein